PEKLIYVIAATEDGESEPLFQVSPNPVVQEQTVLPGHTLGRNNQKISVEAVFHTGKDVTSGQEACHRDSCAKVQVVYCQAVKINAKFAIHLFHALKKSRKEDFARNDRSTNVTGFSSPSSSHCCCKFIEKVANHTHAVLDQRKIAIMRSGRDR